MRELDDWRLTNQLCYLKGAIFSWQPYAPASTLNDHDHCEFCFAKFMAIESTNILTSGYATADRYRWVCKTCFSDFSDLFEWKAEGVA
ncbi:hypothetical protein LJR129_002814 [Acidovorax sp. LjRoot129]|uniref:hypothetical protein n=1 Tax=Acidovorax sp. LjRoot129 TaxID=3342260 RepID=UPI003ECF9677